MLRALEIKNLLIVDKLEIEFQQGLNVLTGETGAGKSILLDAVGFALGERGRVEVVRQGAGRGDVVAVFDVPKDHSAQVVLQQVGLSCTEEIIVRRSNTADGRRTSWINDQRVSTGILRQLSEELIELHGSHSELGLLNPSGHMAQLDEFGCLQRQKDAVKRTWSELAKTRDSLDNLKAKTEKAAQEEDFLRHAVDELDAFNPQLGEDEALDTRRRQMQRAERIRTDIVRAADLLGPEGVEGATTNAIRWLEGVVEDSDEELQEAIAAVSRAGIEVSDASARIARVLEGLVYDPKELDAVEERLFALRSLARKHGVDTDKLANFGDSLRQRLEQLEANNDDLIKARKQVDSANQQYQKAAKKLSQTRVKAAQALDQVVMAELPPLKLERATFATEVQPRKPSADGIDSVHFSVATNPGSTSGPLQKIASGGELSRFLLALRVCLASSSGAQTLIFDEIDRGVSGATADAIGRRLAKLSEANQILVVTHSPQVAARGAHHWRVEKTASDDKTVSTVKPLNETERINEIARMLAGNKISDEARAAAKVLLTN
ncbi:MAG: DNA repair protein RecN [Aestuariivita sp.]|nr:DNA repair protein RecN [Aestuariivita sp.]MCY4202419.1 DNA repair protein RecN [Aestuariivita sp.]